MVTVNPPEILDFDPSISPEEIIDTSTLPLISDNDALIGSQHLEQGDTANRHPNQYRSLQTEEHWIILLNYHIIPPTINAENYVWHFSHPAACHQQLMLGFNEAHISQLWD